MRKGVERFSSGVAGGIEWLGVAGLTALAIIIFVEIIRRYAFNVTSATVEELELHIFVGICYLGAAVAWKRRRHITVDIISERLGIKGKSVLDVVSWVFSFFLCVMCIYGGIKMLQREFVFPSVTGYIGIWYFWLYLVFTVAMVILVFYIIESGVKLFRSLKSPSAEEAKQ